MNINRPLARLGVGQKAADDPVREVARLIEVVGEFPREGPQFRPKRQYLCVHIHLPWFEPDQTKGYERRALLRVGGTANFIEYGRISRPVCAVSPLSAQMPENGGLEGY